MNSFLATVLALFFRWLHIASVVVLIGSVTYAWVAKEELSPKFKPLAWTVMATIIISGLYNFLTKPFYPPGYQMWFGIKMLLVLHIMAAMVLLLGKSTDDAKRSRRMGGIVVSATLIILISAYLRWISMHGGPV